MPSDSGAGLGIMDSPTALTPQGSAGEAEDLNIRQDTTWRLRHFTPAASSTSREWCTHLVSSYLASLVVLKVSMATVPAAEAEDEAFALPLRCSFTPEKPRIVNRFDKRSLEVALVKTTYTCWVALSCACL